MEQAMAVATVLLNILAVFLSLAVRSIPKLANWFYVKVPEDYRFLSLAGVLGVVAALIYPWSCYSPWPVVACEPASAWPLLVGWFSAVVSTQLAYAAKSPPDAEIQARAKV